MFDFGLDLGLKLGQTKPPENGAAPANRNATIPHDSGPISECFDDDPKLLNCEMAQPSIPGELRPQTHLVGGCQTPQTTPERKYTLPGQGQLRLFLNQI